MKGNAVLKGKKFLDIFCPNALISFSAVTNILLHASCAAPDLSSSQLGVVVKLLCPVFEKTEKIMIFFFVDNK